MPHAHEGIVTDNGYQFTSTEFQTFMAEFTISTPPKAWQNEPYSRSRRAWNIHHMHARYNWSTTTSRAPAQTRNPVFAPRENIGCPEPSFLQMDHAHTTMDGHTVRRHVRQWSSHVSCIVWACMGRPGGRSPGLSLTVHTMQRPHHWQQLPGCHTSTLSTYTP